MNKSMHAQFNHLPPTTIGVPKRYYLTEGGVSHQNLNVGIAYAHGCDRGVRVAYVSTEVALTLSDVGKIEDRQRATRSSTRASVAWGSADSANTLTFKRSTSGPEVRRFSLPPQADFAMRMEVLDDFDVLTLCECLGVAMTDQRVGSHLKYAWDAEPAIGPDGMYAKSPGILGVSSSLPYSNENLNAVVFRTPRLNFGERAMIDVGCSASVQGKLFPQHGIDFNGLTVVTRLSITIEIVRRRMEKGLPDAYDVVFTARPFTDGELRPADDFAPTRSDTSGCAATLVGQLDSSSLTLSPKRVAPTMAYDLSLVRPMAVWRHSLYRGCVPTTPICGEKGEPPPREDIGSDCDSISLDLIGERVETKPQAAVPWTARAGGVELPPPTNLRGAEVQSIGLRSPVLYPKPRIGGIADFGDTGWDYLEYPDALTTAVYYQLEGQDTLSGKRTAPGWGLAETMKVVPLEPVGFCGVLSGAGAERNSALLSAAVLYLRACGFDLTEGQVNQSGAMQRHVLVDKCSTDMIFSPTGETTTAIKLMYDPEPVYRMARTVLRALRGTDGRVPILLAGHSLGGYGVAEVARLLGNVGVGVDTILAYDPVWHPLLAAKLGTVFRAPEVSPRHVGLVVTYNATAWDDWFGHAIELAGKIVGGPPLQGYEDGELMPMRGGAMRIHGGRENRHKNLTVVHGDAVQLSEAINPYSVGGNARRIFDPEWTPINTGRRSLSEDSFDETMRQLNALCDAQSRVFWEAFKHER
jgi:hypothetical protein